MRVECHRTVGGQVAAGKRDVDDASRPAAPVALTSNSFEAGSVDDGHLATRVADYPGMLQGASGQRDGGAAHIEHVGEEVMREREGVGEHSATFTAR